MGVPGVPKVPIKGWWPVWGPRAAGGQRAKAEPGPEPGRAWRLLALCGAAVFLAAAAAGGALVAWNLAASAARGTPCPEAEVHNATVPPPTPPRVPEAEVRELQRRLAEAAERAESLSAQLVRAERGRRGLQQALKTCENQQVGGHGGGRGGGTGVAPAHVAGFPALQLRAASSILTLIPC